ncbi:leukocyte surface antigen CD53-like [Culex pipiens pallens]|uniref:leukocyte surface antigen CD53-like n=1 Tax=Culex pipiens pallens TaxID=42434 RepID=UPI00195395A9|nr:leukocyte surface antigen CD53-like [Culex pipiens pallens]
MTERLEPVQPANRVISRKALSIVKYLVLLVTGMCVVMEVIQVVLSASAGHLFGEFELFIDDHFISLTQFLVATGIVTLILVLVGCVGIILENVSIITVYIALFVTMVILETIVAIASYTMGNRVDSMLRVNLNYAFNRYHGDLSVQRSVDHMQQRVECCGFKGYQDWYNWMIPETGESPVPASCFSLTHLQIPFQGGCFSLMNQLIGYVVNLMSSGTTIVIIFQVICIISAVVLVIKLKSFKKHRVAQTSSRTDVYNNDAFNLEPILEEKVRY